MKCHTISKSKFFSTWFGGVMPIEDFEKQMNIVSEDIV